MRSPTFLQCKQFGTFSLSLIVQYQLLKRVSFKNRSDVSQKWTDNRTHDFSPALKMRQHLCFRYSNICRISIAVLENVPPDARLQKSANFSTLIVGLAGDQTRDA
jgi:hypothetical protein